MVARVKSQKAKKGSRFVTKRQMKRAINAETQLHHTDNAAVAEEIDTTGIVVENLTAIAQGDTDLLRTGDEVRPRRVEFNYFLQCKSTSIGPDLCRVILFQYKENSAIALPTKSTIIQSTATANPLQPYNNDHLPAYKILYDHTVSLDDFSNSKSIYQRRVVIPESKLLKKITYQGGASTEGFNNIYLYAWGATAAGTGSSQLSWYSRIHFEP